MDVGIVEGCVNNTDQEHELKMLRDRCKVLIALGDCAVTGNIPALRNQFTLKDCWPRAYEQAESNQISCIPNDPVVPCPALSSQGPAASGGREGGPAHPRLPARCRPIWYAVHRTAGRRTPHGTKRI